MNGIFGYDSKLGNFLTKCVNYIFLFMLWIIFSLPVLTAGASTCAFYYTYNKAVLHDNGYIWKSFWKSFKMNFKQALGLWVIRTIVCTLLVLNSYAAYLLCNTGMSRIVMWLLIIVSVAVFLWSMYWFPYVARFEDRTVTVIKNTGIIMIRNFSWSLLILILTMVLVLLYYQLFPVGILGMTAVYVAIIGKIYIKILRKYMTQEAIAEEDDLVIEVKEDDVNNEVNNNEDDEVSKNQRTKEVMLYEDV